MLSFGGAASRYAGFCLVTPRNLIELSKEEGGWQPTTLSGSRLLGKGDVQIRRLRCQAALSRIVHLDCGVRLTWHHHLICSSSGHG